MELASEVRSLETVTVLEDHTALGLYEGLHVPLSGDGVLVHVHPARVVVATGAAEEHGIFPGNDLPGVMLGRAAAALAGVHGVRPGDRAVVVVRTDEGLQHLRTLVDAGVQVVATAVTAELADRLPEGVGEVVLDGEVHEARGGASLRSVVLRRGGRGKRFDCDVLVLSLGFAPRDGLARMALPNEAVSVVGDAALRPTSPAHAVTRERCACARTSRCTTSSRRGTRATATPRIPEAVHDHDDGPVPGGDVRPGAVVLRR